MPPGFLLTCIPTPLPSSSAILLLSTLKVPNSGVLASPAPPLWAFFSLFAGESVLDDWLHLRDKIDLAATTSPNSPWQQWAGTHRGCSLSMGHALSKLDSLLSFGYLFAPCRDFSLWLLVKWLRAMWFYTLFGCSTCGCGPGWAYCDSTVYSIRSNSKFFPTWPGSAFNWPKRLVVLAVCGGRLSEALLNFV